MNFKIHVPRILANIKLYAIINLIVSLHQHEQLMHEHKAIITFIYARTLPVTPYKETFL